MLRRTALLALALVAGLLLTVPAGASAQSQTQVKQVPWMGTMVDGPVVSPAPQDFESQWPLMRATHLSFVRLAFYWPDLEPKKGVYDFRGVDALVIRAVAQGMDVLPVVLRTPRWAAASKRPGAPPKDRAAYAALMTKLVERYGPQGTLWRDYPLVAPRPIREWQVWNEPDLTVYWNAKNWAKGYVGLLKPAYAAIKAADPGATVVLSGLTNQSWKGLAQVYKAGGRRAFDAAALHVYTSTGKGVATVAGYARKVMRANGDARKPIWLTEVTWPSSQGRRAGARSWETTEKGQAKQITAGLPTLAKARKRLGIDKVVWYSWLTVEDKKTWQTYSGLLRLRKGKIVPVPGFSAFTKVLAKLAG